jgi:outer membrane protein assembly factor BamB
MRRLVAIPLFLAMWACGESAEWTTHQGNPFHTGYVPTDIDLSNLKESWYVPQPTVHYHDGIVVGPDHLYISTHQVTRMALTAYSRVNGQQQWQYTSPNGASINPAAYSDGRVYFQTNNGIYDTFLRCHDASTGAFLYRSQFGAQWDEYLAPTIVDGEVYINGGENGGMYSFRAVDGTQRWFSTLPQVDGWTPAVNTTHAIAYFAIDGGGLVMVNRGTGAIDRFISDPNAGPSYFQYQKQAVALDGNQAFVTNGRRLVKFDIEAGVVAWEVSRNFGGQVTVGPQAVYAVDGGALTALDKATGNFLWQVESPLGSFAGPVIVTNRQLIAQTGTHTVIFDLSTRSQVWSYPNKGPMALVDDELFISGLQGVSGLSLNPIPHQLQGLTLSKSATAGMNSVMAVAQMNTVAERDEVISFWDNTQLISTPSTAVLRKGQRSVGVRVTTSPVSVPAVRTIYARYAGVTKSADLQLLPLGPSAMASLAPSPITGGTRFFARVALTGPAPQGGLVINLTSDSQYVLPPPSVTVPAGKANANFIVDTAVPPISATGRITARYKGLSAGVTVRIVRP